MIRKQLYLEETQDRALKRRAKALGVSEAELVRRALDTVLSDLPHHPRSDGLEELFAEADAIAQAYQFAPDEALRREDLYDGPRFL